MRTLLKIHLILGIIAIFFPSMAASAAGGSVTVAQRPNLIAGKLTGYLLADTGPCWVFRYKKTTRSLTTTVNPGGSVSAYTSSWVVSLSLDKRNISISHGQIM
jgi:hypothetical protein